MTRSRLNLSPRASPTDPALREKESESRDLVFAERDLAIDWQNSPERHRQSQPTRGPSTRLAAQARLALAQDDIRWNAFRSHPRRGHGAARAQGWRRMAGGIAGEQHGIDVMEDVPPGDLGSRGRTPRGGIGSPTERWLFRLGRRIGVPRLAQNDDIRRSVCPVSNSRIRKRTPASSTGEPKCIYFQLHSWGNQVA
jgi:hypothetical protein